MAMSKTQKREARLNQIPLERREPEDRPRMRPLRPDEIKRRAEALRLSQQDEIAHRHRRWATSMWSPGISWVH